MLLLWLLSLTCAADEDALLRFVPGEETTRVHVAARVPPEVSRLLPDELEPRDARRFLQLRLVRSEESLGPPIFGEYRREKGRLIFEPRHALVPGERYRAALEFGETRVTRDYRVPERKEAEPPRVLAVYPSTPALPSNHLKFYIHFSRPMREGREIFERIRIEHADGRVVPDAWRRTELWSDDARRLTLWIHPGRVKTGLQLRDELGPVLEPGRKYKLVIDGTLRGAQGQPLGNAFAKEFRTAEADRARPLPQKWKLTRPAAGTREPLRLEFGEPLDRALLERFFEVRDSKERPVPGEIVVADHETVWIFRPESPWKPGEHAVHVEETLEDLAGNTPRRLFDRDLHRPHGPEPQLRLPFRPEAP